MAADEVTSWLQSGLAAQLGGLELYPLEHPALPAAPLAVQRGQATAYYVRTAAGVRYILKKFLPGRAPEAAYLIAVANLVPTHDGLTAATTRQVLTAADLSTAPGCYCDRGLSAWLDGTLLMQCVEGLDWASLADEIREGDIQLQSAHRLALVHSLASLVALLEQAQCAHRDLSCGNVFIDPFCWAIRLIDFDSLFHPALSMPCATTCGTNGYASPNAWRHGRLDPTATWTAHADRFALAILAVEFLVMEPGAPLAGEGGLFEQDELRARRGQRLDWAVDRLKQQWPGAVPLVEQNLAATNFANCPTPDTWVRFAAENGLGHKAPRLSELSHLMNLDLALVLRRRHPPAPLWPAPRLSDIPWPEIRKPHRSPQPSPAIVPLPPDPWSSVALKVGAP